MLQKKRIFTRISADILMASFTREGFNLVGLGGTFDFIHEGHQLLLQTAFQVGKKVVIGLSTDELLANKEYKEQITYSQ